MGEITAGSNAEPSKQIIKPADTGTGSERAEGKSTGAASTGTGAGTGSRTGTAAGSAAGTETQKIPGLASVDPDEQKRLEKNRRRREQYAKQKAENGGTVKPRKVNKKKEETPAPVDNAQIGVLIGTVSGIVASRPGCEHWQLSQKEIESIANPLSNMIAESDYLEKLGEYSNQIALVTACMTAFVPRAILSYQKMQEEKKKHDVIRKIEPNKKPVETVNRKDDSGRSGDAGNPGDNVPWYAAL